MDYVCGFCIDVTQERVLLVEKNRPEFQKGKWNGIGGKIEPDETPITAMVREFYEEAGIITAPDDWICTVIMTGNNDRADEGKPFKIYYYRMICGIAAPQQYQMTDEPVAWIPYVHGGLWNLPTLPNMRWIFPLQLTTNVSFPIEVTWSR